MVKVDLEALRTQADSAKNSSEQARRALKSYQKSASKFQSADQLKGEAYQSAKNYCSGPMNSLLTGADAFYEGASMILTKLVDQYEATVDSKSWDSEELHRLIQEADRIIQQQEQIIENIKNHKKKKASLGISSHNLVIEVFKEMKRHFEEILQHLEEFSIQSTSWFNSLQEVEASLSSAISSLSEGLNISDGSISMPKNRGWEAKLLDFDNKLEDFQNTKNMSKDEKEYYYTLQDVYGFDKNTAKSIIKVKQGIDKNFPNLSQQEKDYLFTRIIGGITYNNDSKLDIWLWNDTAGNVTKYFTEAKKIDDCLKQLGLNKKEIKVLNESLSYQHSLARQRSSISTLKNKKQFDGVKQEFEDIHNVTLTNKEFEWIYNQYKKHPDFTHQMITMSTHLNKRSGIGSEIMSKYEKNDNHSNKTYINELSGWRGDVTSETPMNIPLGGNDDYMSDLDSVNITSKMKENNSSFLETTNNYYKDLRTNKINRAKEFKKYQNFSEVEQEIQEDKHKNKFSEDFLKALKNNQNTLYK